MTPGAIAGVVLADHLSYDMIGELPADSLSTEGTRLLQAHFPAGIVGPVTVLLVDPQFDFGSAQGQALVSKLTRRLQEQKEKLGLADIRSVTAPLGITAASQHDYSGLNVSQQEREKAIHQEALKHYLTKLGQRNPIGTRLDLIWNGSPFDPQSVADLNRVEEAIRADLPENLRQDCQISCVGVTASVRDLAAIVQADRTRIEVLVLGSVLLILIFLLRRLVIPVYLLLSVLFSYYTTLGITFAVFWLLDPHGFSGLDWKVAIFLFTILVAVGEDYNIFLMTRVSEEERRHGPLGGITEALDRTGPIISSCGIIMAGTFASLLAGSLAEMKQLGFALTFGVLLDTFIVRPILVPAFLIILRQSRL